MNSQREITGRAIIVLGMHRSGTSMLTRCIHLLGAEVARQVIPTDAAINRNGFFEDAKVIALNDELLAMLGSCWYDFKPLRYEAVDPERIRRWQNQALDHLQEEYSDKRLSVIKDPRMSRLWIYWQSMFEQAGLNVDMVHIVRQPENVAMSLNRRNGMPLAYGLLLWCAHVIDILRIEDNEEPCTTLFYESFLGDPHKNVKFITAMLGSDIVDEPDYAYIEGEIGKPLSSSSPSSDGALALIQDLRDFTLQLYQVLENNCNDGKLVIARQEVERLNNEYQQLLSRCAAEFKTLGVLTNELMSLSSKLVEVGGLHSQAQHVVEERDAQLAELNRDLKRVGAELEYAQSIVAERDGQLVALNAERDTQVTGLNEQVAELNEQVARYENIWFRRTWRYVRRPFL